MCPTVSIGIGGNWHLHNSNRSAFATSASASQSLAKWCRLRMSQVRIQFGWPLDLRPNCADSDGADHAVLADDALNERSSCPERRREVVEALLAFGPLGHNGVR